MSAQNEGVVSALNRVLRELGFVRKGSSWHREVPALRQVIHLQRSQFGEQYYLNFGVLIKAIEDLPFPKESRCHVRVRVSRCAAAPSGLEQLLNLEREAPDRTAQLESRLREVLQPLSEECRTIAGLSTRFSSGTLRGAIVTAGARIILQGGQGG